MALALLAGRRARRPPKEKKPSPERAAPSQDGGRAYVKEHEENMHTPKMKWACQVVCCG